VLVVLADNDKEVAQHRNPIADITRQVFATLSHALIGAGGLGCRVSLDELVQVDEALVAEYVVVEQGQDVGDLRIVEGEEFFPRGTLVAGSVAPRGIRTWYRSHR
jgi:hypothetical protein